MIYYWNIGILDILFYDWNIGSIMTLLYIIMIYSIRRPSLKIRCSFLKKATGLFFWKSCRKPAGFSHKIYIGGPVKFPTIPVNMGPGNTNPPPGATPRWTTAVHLHCRPLETRSLGTKVSCRKWSLKLGSMVVGDLLRM